MSKLLKFKDWLTIEEASNYLTKAFNELVKPTDIYRLAIENKLVLSLFFVNNTYIEVATKDSNNALIFNNNYQLINNNSYCDLVNCDNSTLILKQHYYNNSDVPLKADNDNNNIIICLPDGLTFGRVINYKEKNRQLSQPTIAPCLPNDIYLIIKTDYLNYFINQATQPEQTKTDLHTKEKDSLYNLLALLLSMNKLSTNKEFKTANIIKSHAENIGVDSPNRDTIAKYLKEASYYLPE